MVWYGKEVMIWLYGEHNSLAVWCHNCTIWSQNLSFHTDRHFKIALNSELTLLFVLSSPVPVKQLSLTYWHAWKFKR